MTQYTEEVVVQVESEVPFSDDIFPSGRLVRIEMGLKIMTFHINLLHSIVIAVISSESSFCCTQLGEVVGFVALALVVPVVAIVLQVIMATAPAMTTMTSMFAIILIARSILFSQFSEVYRMQMKRL